MRPCTTPCSVTETGTTARSHRGGRWLHIAIALAILGGIALWVDLDAVTDALRSLPATYLVAALGLATADRCLMAYKWRHLVIAGGARLGILAAVRIYYQAGASGRVIPAPLGAEALRAYLATLVGVPGGLAISSVMLERFIAFLTLVFAALLGVAYLGVQEPANLGRPLFLLIAAIIVAAGVISVGSMVFVPAQRAAQGVYTRLTTRWPLPARIERMLGKVARSLADYQSQRKALLQNALLSLLEHGLQLVKLSVVAAGLGIATDNLALFAVLAVALFIRRMGGIIEGLGLGEGSAVAVVILLGIEPALAVALFFVNFAITTVAVLPGAILFYTHPVNILQARQQEQG
jgi:glycosyltransferase 2 family protein